MSHDILESDWRAFRRLHARALEEFCSRTLDDLRALTNDDGRTALERYRAADALWEKRDRELARVFDDYRRSTAVMQLGIMLGCDLVTEEDLAPFSERTRESARFLAGRSG